MRKSLVLVLSATVWMSGSAVLSAQAPAMLNSVASPSSPLSTYRVQVRTAHEGGLAASTPGTQAGQFAFNNLEPGRYIVELVDSAGKVAGLSAPLSVSAGSTVTVTVGGTAADALASNRSPKLELGPLASVAVAGASSDKATTNVLATREGRLVVCHKASGVAQPLSISESAREGHLGHGDTLGACPGTAGR
jgi:hypothetical protein